MSDYSDASESEQFICFDPLALGPLNQLSSSHWDKIIKWLELIEIEATESLYQFQYGHVIGPFSTPNLRAIPNAHISSPVAQDEFILMNNLHPPCALNPAGPAICMYQAGGGRICGSTFTSRSSFWRHLYRIHTAAAIPHWRKKGALPHEYRLEAFRAELLFILQGKWPKMTNMCLEDIPVAEQCTLRLAIEICLHVQEHSPSWAASHPSLLCRRKPIFSPPSPMIITPPRKRKLHLNPVQTMRLTPAPKTSNSDTIQTDRYSRRGVQTKPEAEREEQAELVRISPVHTESESKTNKSRGRGFFSRLVSSWGGPSSGSNSIQSELVDSENNLESALRSNHEKHGNNLAVGKDTALETEYGLYEEQSTTREEQQQESMLQATRESTPDTNTVPTGQELETSKRRKVKVQDKKPTRASVRTRSKQKAIQKDSRLAGVQDTMEDHTESEVGADIGLASGDASDEPVRTVSESSQRRQQARRGVRRQGQKYSR